MLGVRPRSPFCTNMWVFCADATPNRMAVRVQVGPKRGGYFFNGYYKAKVDASKSPDYGNFGYPSVEAPALDKE